MTEKTPIPLAYTLTPIPLAYTLKMVRPRMSRTRKITTNT